MVHDMSSPKRLSPWAPFEVPAKIEAWLREHREVRLVADEDRGDQDPDRLARELSGWAAAAEAGIGAPA